MSLTRTKSEGKAFPGNVSLERHANPCITPFTPKLEVRWEVYSLAGHRQAPALHRLKVFGLLYLRRRKNSPPLARRRGSKKPLTTSSPGIHALSSRSLTEDALKAAVTPLKDRAKKCMAQGKQANVATAVFPFNSPDEERFTSFEESSGLFA